MFPTLSKTRIPHTLAYPLSAKLVSEALAEVPQASEMALHFSYMSSSAFRQQSTSCQVIFISYSHREADRFMPRQIDELRSPQWTIWIEPVPISMKKHVQELLLSQALPKANDWLCARGHVTGRIETHNWRVSYNQDFDRLDYREHFKL